MAKICSKCKKEKDVSEFSKDKYRKDGLRNWCRNCVKQWKETNKHHIKKYNKYHYEKNLEYYKQKNKIYLEENPEYFQIWKKENPEYFQIWKKENPEYFQIWRKENSEYIKDYRNQYKKQRYNNDPIFKLRHNVSISIRAALKSQRSSKKGSSILQFLPYSIQQLKEHLEKQFEPWMNWENHGIYKNNEEKTWHIDHIIPHSSFHYETMDCEEFKKCWALENLRPLEALENLKKSDNVES